LSRAAYYADARRQRGQLVGEAGDVVGLPKRPRYTVAEVVLLRIREVLTQVLEHLAQVGHLVAVAEQGVLERGRRGKRARRGLLPLGGTASSFLSTRAENLAARALSRSSGGGNPGMARLVNRPAMLVARCSISPAVSVASLPLLRMDRM
jgi:hypothetical protein